MLSTLTAEGFFPFLRNRMCQLYLFLGTWRISPRKDLRVHKYAVCTLGSGPSLDTFPLTEPSALVSAFCQSAKLEARVRFSYRKTSQKRSGYKPVLAFMIFFLSRWCLLSVFTVCILWVIWTTVSILFTLWLLVLPGTWLRNTADAFKPQRDRCLVCEPQPQKGPMHTSWLWTHTSSVWHMSKCIHYDMQCVLSTLRAVMRHYVSYLLI